MCPVKGGPGCEVTGGPVDWVAYNQGCRWISRTGWPAALKVYDILFDNLVDLSIGGPGCEGTGGPVGLGGL